VSPKAITALFAASLVALALVVVAVVGVSKDDASNAQPSASVVAPKTAFEGAVLPPGVRAPNFSLEDENGKRVTMKEYRGEPVVVTFMYSHCRDTCPIQAQQIKGALDNIGQKLPALSISVDPPGDTPKSVHSFNDEQGVTGRIRWVLGSEPQLRRLWEGFHTTSQTGGAEHMARIVLIDKRGFQRVGYPSSQATPERLAHDLRLLVKE
jgi:protein SCO1